jgi:branched-chain amino acid transport system substrate-binding protein
MKFLHLTALMAVCLLQLFAAEYAAAGGGAANGGPDNIQQRIVRTGTMLGSASRCPDVAPARIQAVKDKIREVIRSSSTSEGEQTALLQSFDRSIAAAQSPQDGAAPVCDTAAWDFSALEISTATVNPQAPGRPESMTMQLGTRPAPAAAPSFQTSSEGAAVRGITAREIRLGIAAPFSGPARELGRQMKLGLETAFAAGGVHGRQIRLIAVDDGYEPARTAEAMKQLHEKEQVFAIAGNVGTPTAAVAAPYALQNRILFYGAFTGAGLLRREPPDRYVFNYRASYTEETQAVVHYLVKIRRLKPEQIAVFAQQDSYGDAGYAGVEKAMRALKKGDASVLRLGYQRNTIAVEDAVAQLRKQTVPQIKAIVIVATYRAAAKFIEKTRDLFPSMIYTNVSFVGSSSLADELRLLGPKYTTGVIVTQVVPPVESFSSIVLKYKSDLEKSFPGETPDYVSLEGYIAGQVLVEALKRAGPQVDTERLVETLEAMRNFDLGLGTAINFGPSEHQGSHKVWGTELNAEGKYQPLDLD